MFSFNLFSLKITKTNDFSKNNRYTFDVYKDAKIDYLNGPLHWVNDRILDVSKLLSLWMKSYGVTIQMKSLQQYFHMLLFI